MKKVIFTTFIIVVLAACKAVILAAPAQSDVDRVKDKYPNYTLAELQKGKKLYELKCQACHGLKNPRKESEEEWREIVPEMVQKAKKKKGIIVSAEEEEAILKYVITMSSAPKISKESNK